MIRFAFSALLLFSTLAHAAVEDIVNFRQYSEVFASSGQPTGAQLRDAEAQNYQRVIYLAYTDNHSAIEHEDRQVLDLGMEYVQLAVDFEAPTLAEFETFAAIMQRYPNKKTLLHCQVNFRASTFSFLYRVIYQQVPMHQAKADLDSVWQPNETWFRFLVSVLEAHGLTHQCDRCDWGALEFVK